MLQNHHINKNNNHSSARAHLFHSAPTTSPLLYVGPYARPRPVDENALPSSPW